MATTYTKPNTISNPTRRQTIGSSGNINDNIMRDHVEEPVKLSKPSSSSISSSQWMNLIRGKLDEYENRLRQDKTIANFEDKYLNRKFPLSYIIASILLLSILTILYIFSGMRSLSTFVGVLYPFYMSLKVLNNQSINEINKQEHMLWLSYWIWYGIFNTLEIFSDVIFGWMGNMYELMKMALFIYLYHPQTKGALFLYHRILQPLLIQLIRYEHVMFENVQTLKKNITIPEHDDLNGMTNNSNFTNTSANTSKNFNIPSVGSGSGSGSNMNIPGSHNNSNSNNNILPPSNKNLMSGIRNTSTNNFGSFQPVAFAATTPLNVGNTIPPIISSASLSNTNVLPPQQNNMNNMNNMNNLPQ